MKVFFVHEKSEERDHWVLRPDGEMVTTGWAYSTIEMLINEYATESELQKPGSAENMIRLIRQSVSEAVAFDDGQQITILRAGATSNWQQSLYDQAAKKLQREGETMTTSFGELRQVDALYEFKHMSCGMVRFGSVVESVVKVQQDLFAA